MNDLIVIEVNVLKIDKGRFWVILSDGETSDIFCISQHCKDIHEKNTECQILKIRLHLMMVRPRDDLS